MATTVVNIRRHAAEIRQAVKEGRYVYIGRGRGANGSKWANPFTWKPGTLAQFVVPKNEVLTSYEAWLLQQPQLMAAIPELLDRVLGCFCSPSRCHGDILARLAEQTRHR